GRHASACWRYTRSSDSFFFSSRRRHTRFSRDWSSDVCSSDLPFEVPMEAQIKGQDEESLFLNSLYYTDKSLGDFIRELKKMPLYEETLIIIIADHGHRMPLSSKNHDKEKFHIPMLWLGGAIAVQDTVINTLSSQTDLAATLLR